MTFHHVGFVGDVLALELFAANGTNASLLFAGVGSQLLVYEFPGGSLLHSCTVLPDAARVHGICVAPLSPGLLAIAVHGDHYARVLTLSVRDQKLTEVAATPRLQRWTMAAELLPLPPARLPAGLTRRGAPVAIIQQPAAMLAVGLSDNSVLLYAVACDIGNDVQVLEPLLHVRCVNAPLLYSMDLRWHVVSGSGGTGSAGSGSGGSGSVGGGLSGTSGRGSEISGNISGSDGGGLRRRGGVSATDRTDSSGGTGAGDSGSSRKSSGLRRRGGVSSTGGDGFESRGSSGGGGGGTATLWVAAGTVFLDVLTWSGPSLSLDTLRASVSKGQQTDSPAASSLPNGDDMPLTPIQLPQPDGSVQMTAMRLPPEADGSADAAELAKLSSMGAAAGHPAAITRPVAQTLLGHVGSIHRVAWSADGSVLASASDDRTVRLWAAGPSAAAAAAHPAADAAAATSPAAPAADGRTPAAAATRAPPGYSYQQQNAAAAAGCAAVQPLAVLHGHAARLWDVDIVGGVVATGSEDRTVRLWRLSDGCQLAELHGHGGRGVWRVRVCGGLLASAGADASVKLWPLADWLPANGLQQRQRTSGDDSGQCVTQAANVSLKRPMCHSSGQCITGSSGGGGGGGRGENGQLPAAIGTNGDGSSGGGGNDGGLVVSDLPVTPASPVGTGGTRHRDSKSEFVRCICLAGADTLFVGTNHGFVHRASLPSGSGTDLIWDSELYTSGERAAVLSIAAFQPPLQRLPVSAAELGAASTDSQAPSDAFGSSRQSNGYSSSSGNSPGCSGDSTNGSRSDSGSYSVLFSDARGDSFHMTVPTGTAGNAVVSRWQPHAGRLVQGLFWSPPLGCGRFFTADSTGELRLWAAPAGREAPFLLATAQSPFQRRSSPRIISLAADPAAGLVVCGDSQGDVFAFALPKQLLTSAAGATKDVPHLQYVAAFPYIHSNAPIGFCAIHSGGRVTSGGRDGSIQQYQCRPPPPLPPQHRPADASGGSQQRRLEASEQALAASCTERLPGISTPVADVELAAPCGGSIERLVAGWQAADFVIASLGAGAELRRFCCGSLHRPFALHLAPGADYTFVFHKGDQLHIHRRQQSGCAPGVPRALHLLHHGMEIGAAVLLLNPHNHAAGCVITGAEDGSLFLVHFNAAAPLQGITSSVRMGEQALGTAVKALASAPLAGLPGAHLVVTGGAKEVLSAWLLQPQPQPIGDASGGGTLNGGHSGTHWSHRWLATRPPPTGGFRRKSTPQGVNAAASDHRTLALRVFGAAAGASPTGDDVTAFVATAGSDGTVKLLHLQVRQQTWQPLAELRHHACPAISLAHLAWDAHPGVGGNHSSSPGIAAAATAAAAAAAQDSDAPPGADRSSHPGPPAAVATAAQGSDGDSGAATAMLQGGSRHLLFSGGTNGGIAAWDITPAVQAARSSMNASESTACSSSVDSGSGGSGDGTSEGGMFDGGSGGCGSNSASGMMQTMAPMHLAPLAVLQGAHQSGVNNLAAAWLCSADGHSQLPLQNGTSASDPAVAGGLAADAMPAAGGGGSGRGGSGDTGGSCGGGGGSASASTAVLVSGGDDQSLAATAVRFFWPATSPLPRRLPTSHDAVNSEGDGAASLASSEQHASAMPGSAAFCSSGGATAAFGAVQRVHNAHASALRAVWTDGDSAFTTGLDQRVRCWRISQRMGQAGGQHVAVRSAQQSEEGCVARSAAAAAATNDIVAAAAAAEHDVSCAAEGPHIDIAEQAAEVTQVLEPSCLAAMPAAGNGHYVVSVAGRGLQVLGLTIC